MRLEHRFDNITLDARNCSTVLLVFYSCVSIIFIPMLYRAVPMVTYTRRNYSPVTVRLSVAVSYRNLCSTQQRIMEFVRSREDGVGRPCFYIALIPAWRIDALYKKSTKCILMK